MAERRMLAAIMFTDIEGYTRLMHERESLALDSLKAHNKVFDELAFKYSGLVVKSIGDSYLIEFPSAVNAVQCALEAQDEFAKRNADLPGPYQLKVRVSIHVGDVVVDDDDVYGDWVNIASRLQSVTPGGAICLSREAYAQVKARLGKRFSSIGEVELKGLDEPLEVFLNSEAAPDRGEARALRTSIHIVIPEPLPQEPREPEPAPPPPAAEPEPEPLRAPEPAAVSPVRTEAPSPPPPPAPAIGPSSPTVFTGLLFAALFALFFGKPWLSVVHADWLGGGWAAALAAVALMRSCGRSWVARAAGMALIVGVVFSLYELAPGAPALSFEIALVGGLGLAVAALASYVGFLQAYPDREVAGPLLLSAAALLTAAGCARALPAGASWAAGLPEFLRAQSAALGASGGAWRWTGLIAAYAAWRLMKMSSFDPADWSR